jgi:thymidylate synthase (FAD)
MILINPSVEILPQKSGLQGIYEQIEVAARTCYKSENCIKYEYTLEGKTYKGDDEYTFMPGHPETPVPFGSCKDTIEHLYDINPSIFSDRTSLTAKDFVDKIVNVYKHQSVAEHGTIYLKVPMSIVTNALAESVWEMLNNNKWTKHDCDSNYYYYTTNYRVLLENDALDVLEYLCEPTEYHERRVTVRTKCPISVSREWNRHRELCKTSEEEVQYFGISEQSTRYCNYSKDKFSNQLTFCIPYWLNLPEGKAYWHDICYRVGCTDEGFGETVLPNNPKFEHDCYLVENFLKRIDFSEEGYMDLIKTGCTAQEARELLPLCTATEVVYTGFISDWKHFFGLRAAPNAHPDIKKLAVNLQQQFKSQHLI